RSDMSLWYDNPDEMHRIVVWANEVGADVLGSNTEDFDDGDMVYRFSLVADNPLDDEDLVRFGITDESSRLHLNMATEAQLTTLFSRAVGEDPDINVPEVVAAILDWRDSDSNPRGLEADTEGDFYQTLPIPYDVKNGNFGTVEELLLVKGVTPEVLYGEDFDRNGLLTPNEDDGEETFPEDNQDGQLNQGLYPYLTTISYETNVSNDNRQRIYLRGDQNVVREQLNEVFPDEPEVVDYIITIVGGSGTGEPAGDENNGEAGGDGDQQQAPGDTQGGGSGRRGRGGNAGNADSQPDKSRSRQQRQPEPDEEGNPDNPPDSADEGDRGDDAGQDDPTGGDPDDRENDPEGDPEQGGEGEESGEQERTAATMQTPVSLLLVAEEGQSRLGLEHLPALLDRTTFIPPETQQIEGLININTAPPPVLACIDGLTEEQIQAILRTRDQVSAEDKATFAWLAVEEVVDLVTLEKIAPQITARGQQYQIEVLGYSDHAGMVTRLVAVVDMLGPIAQTLYQKDISYLGGGFPIREEDLERVRGR
ncbi:MAG: type II secretion system protein GspK, partial [Phycisphaerae bacterium]